MDEFDKDWLNCIQHGIVEYMPAFILIAGYLFIIYIVSQLISFLLISSWDVYIFSLLLKSLLWFLVHVFYVYVDLLFQISI